MTACGAGEPLAPTADADNVFVFLINENLIANSKKSRGSGGSGRAVWFGELCLSAPALFTPPAPQAKGICQVMFLLPSHKNPFSQNTPLKPEIKVRRWRQWRGGDRSLCSGRMAQHCSLPWDKV